MRGKKRQDEIAGPSDKRMNGDFSAFYEEIIFIDRYPVAQ